MKYIIICMLWACTTYGQGDLDKKYSSEGIQHVLIDNLRGDILVEVGDKNTIEIKATASDYKASQSLKLKEVRQEGLIAIYIEKPCLNEIGKFDPASPYHFLRNNGDCYENRHQGVLPTYNFIVKIPRNMNIYVSTIMDGDVVVSDVSGGVFASNINGDIRLDEVSNVRNATTINGDVDVNFNAKPTMAGHFSTINGEINLLLPYNASLKTKFKSFSGELYTDFNAVEVINEKREKDKVEAGKMIEIERYSMAKIGSGEVSFLIETFNGNAYLKANKK